MLPRLVLLLALLGAALPAAASAAPITGQVQCRPADAVPLRGARVELMRLGALGVPSIVGVAFTDEQGRWSLDDQQRDGAYFVRAVLRDRNGVGFSAAWSPWTSNYDSPAREHTGGTSQSLGALAIDDPACAVWQAAHDSAAEIVETTGRPLPLPDLGITPVGGAPIPFVRGAVSGFIFWHMLEAGIPKDLGTMDREVARVVMAARTQANGASLYEGVRLLADGGRLDLCRDRGPGTAFELGFAAWWAREGQELRCAGTAAEGRVRPLDVANVLEALERGCGRDRKRMWEPLSRRTPTLPEYLAALGCPVPAAPAARTPVRIPPIPRTIRLPRATQLGLGRTLSAARADLRRQQREAQLATCGRGCTAPQRRASAVERLQAELAEVRLAGLATVTKGRRPSSAALAAVRAELQRAVARFGKTAGVPGLRAGGLPPSILPAPVLLRATTELPFTAPPAPTTAPAPASQPGPAPTSAPPPEPQPQPQPAPKVETALALSCPEVHDVTQTIPVLAKLSPTEEGVPVVFEYRYDNDEPVTSPAIPTDGKGNARENRYAAPNPGTVVVTARVAEDDRRKAAQATCSIGVA